MVVFPLILIQVVTMAVGLASIPNPVDIAKADNTKPEIIISFTSSLPKKSKQNVDGIQNRNISAAEGSGSVAVDTNDEVRKVSDLTEDLLEWEAPTWYQKYCPYYHAGYDDDGRPVWIAEFGKFPLQQLSQRNEDGYREFDKVIKQAALRIIKSIQAQNTTENEVNEAVYLVDLDGLNMLQLGSSKTILFLIRVFTGYKDLITNYLGACILINVHYLTEASLNFLRPIFVNALDKFEIFGTNPAKWKPALRRKLPQSVLPPWYGGSEDFTPIQIYG